MGHRHKRSATRVTNVKKLTTHKRAINHLSKLGSKKLNSLAKQGKLKNFRQRKSFQKLLTDRTHSKYDPVEVGPEKNVDNEEDIPLEEADYEYFAQPGRDFSFLLNLSENDEKEEKKTKKSEASKSIEDMEDKYMKKLKENTPKTEVKPLLPLKNKKGLIPQSREIELQSDEEKEDEKPTQEEEEELPALSVAELFMLRQKKLQEQKCQIAELAGEILGNPHEAIAKLKELRMMLTDLEDTSVTIRKLVMISLQEIFKDIIPGYRIRIASETEKTQAITKETKTLRGYEEGLVNNYRQYLEYLESLISVKKKSKGKILRNLPLAVRQELEEVAVKCLCSMLTSHPHFNFRTNIIAVLVPLMTGNKGKIPDQVCDCVKQVFREDKAGDVTLEIVRLIGRTIKAKDFDVEPRLLDTFLSLRIKEIDQEHGKKKKISRKDRQKTMSKRERKREKNVRFLKRELEEAAALDDRTKKLKYHTEIINMIFLTYFRILKRATYSTLLSTVLEGLAKFAHFINIDFFDDLFAVLNQLIASDELTYRESLHCVQTAFVILSGQGSALTIDPQGFYRHLYKTLFDLHAGLTSEDVPIAIECLFMMITKRKKQISLQRLLGFIKRISSLSLQMESHAALALLAMTRQFLIADSKTDILFDTEYQGSGLYQPELDDPEYCKASNTALYELPFLQRHYHPMVRRYGTHITTKGANQQIGLPVEILRQTPMELYKAYNTNKMEFVPAVPTKPVKSKKVRRGGFTHSELQDKMNAVFDAIPDKIANINFTTHSKADHSKSNGLSRMSKQVMKHSKMTKKGRRKDQSKKTANHIST